MHFYPKNEYQFIYAKMDLPLLCVDKSTNRHQIKQMGNQLYADKILQFRDDRMSDKLSEVNK